MKEIYTLSVELESMYDDFSWKKVVEITEETNFFNLHSYIQKIIDFDDDHLYEFFVGKNSRKRERVFGDEGGYGLDEQESLNTQLNEVYPINKGSKLYYHFDFGDSWIFKIIKSRKKKYVEKGADYPRLIESEGENPEQYPDYE